MTTPIMKYFQFDHLPAGEPKNISAKCCQMAKDIDASIADGPEKSAGLRKLLEAKDCFVRACLP